MTFKWSEYSKNMYFGGKSKAWTKFNLKRIKLVKKTIQKHLKKGQTLEIGSYDLFSITNIMHQKNKHKFKEITLLDLYTEKEIYAIAKNNMNLLKEKYPKTKFELKRGDAQKLNLKKKYDNVFAFETLEHIKEEKKAIENIGKITKKDGLLFISYPIEFGAVFVIKSIGRKILLGNDKHTIKELFYGLIGKTKKLTKIKGSHRGYDFRETFRELEKNKFKLQKNKYYPINNKFFAYGGCAVFRKK